MGIMKIIKDIILCTLMSAMFILLGIRLITKEPDIYSYSERRVLAYNYNLNYDTIKFGNFMTEYEEYLLDQFPLRESFRTVKALNEHYMLNKMDSNDIYISNGYLSKIDYPLNVKLVDNTCRSIIYIYDNYLADKGIKPYLAIIPDKNYFLSDDSGHLSIDYDQLYKRIQSKIEPAHPINIREKLDISDYYYTDTHWRQECIIDAANQIAFTMGVSINDNYRINTLNRPFNGVYVGQSALPIKPDKIKYLTSNAINNSIVTIYDGSKPVIKSIYDFNKAESKDPYEMFLSGAVAVLTIDNEKASTDRELIVFRDSFGSSLIPLLVNAYKKITLIDIRYINKKLLGEYIEFDSQDVLFMYSTLYFNNMTNL